MGHRDGGAHLRVAPQSPLDLPQLDPLALNLDLEIGPTQDLEGAVGQDAPEVAGPVQPLAGSGVGQEFRSGPLLVPPVGQLILRRGYSYSANS